MLPASVRVVNTQQDCVLHVTDCSESENLGCPDALARVGMCCNPRLEKNSVVLLMCESACRDRGMQEPFLIALSQHQ